MIKSPVATFSPDFVIYALRSAGYRQTDIANDLGRHLATVCSVVNGRARSQLIEARIADVTGLGLEVLWPQWHGPNAAKDRRRKVATSNEQLVRAKALLASLESKSRTTEAAA